MKTNEKAIINEFHFAVDVPNPNTIGQPNAEWINVNYFETKADAIKFAQEHLGADENGMICVISSF